MKCAYCECDIEVGDTYYDIDGKPVCIDCVLDYLEENCKDKDDDGEDIYVVDDCGWDVDEVGSLLKARERKLEGEPPEDNLKELLTNRFGELI